ncbi:alpha-N-acetylgalactosaminidase-like [Oppia nitens]|uniref:alpha-N-acetylgalactosaminidase-like n=1 Tax=Oppia nitens TaxID=1686743 RepID=UPI0023DC0C16|nr:alpha-N-acetylgalactosaminidase-like [Oppia nitens]
MLIKLIFHIIFLLTILLPNIPFLLARDDGLALTPPMGFLSWERFACQTDCDRYPHSCINEQLYKDMADRLVADGYRELGYEYVNVDDCWSEKQRDSSGRLVADRKRFPSGIKALADYMHARRLKLGIYGDVGNLTCGGYPGQNNHTAGGHDYYDLDAQTVADWGVDSFKSDGCYEEPLDFDRLYPKMDKALNATGRNMVFICEWPFYQYVYRNMTPDYEAIAHTCHVYRSYKDVVDSWASIDEIITYYGTYNDLFRKYNGPGHFSDPDELTIGNWGLSWEQSRTQMAMWSMWSSPLYISTDLRKLRPEFKAILQNRAVIAVNQDRHGIMAKRVFADTNRQVWVKQVEPVVNGQWSYAVAYLNRELLGDAIYMSHKLSDLIPDTKPGVKYEIHDLFLDEGKEILGTITRDDQLELLINTAGAVRMVKLLVK